MKAYEFERRQYVIGGIAFVVVLAYILRLAFLQLFPNDYDEISRNNAIYNRIIFPSRGSIYDRNGKLLVYNEPAYDVMVITREVGGLDTLDFCRTLHMTREEFEERMRWITDRDKNPGFSSYSEQLFRPQISSADFLVFQEKMFRYKGFYVRERNARQYRYPNAAHVLGYVAEVSGNDIAMSDYYSAGDYIGKQGVERSYEEVLRGQKGIEVLLRDARGKIQGRYNEGRDDQQPIPGKDIVLSLDIELQALGERLMRGKRGAIVAIEPSTGEILCMVSAPSYSSFDMVGKERGERIMSMLRDPSRPMFNRAISGTYPPGSTFKPSQALTFLQEGVIQGDVTSYPCSGGFRYRNLKVGCHSHPSPLSVGPALSTSPNADYYDKHLNRWNALTVISIAIGQGEVTLTPLQIANQGATIANRGFYITPHIVRRIVGGELADSLTRRHFTKAEPRFYEQVVSGMRGAVTSGIGTCRGAQNPWYEVCGKTGTAQNRGHDHSVFMGFAPRVNPQIAVAVYVENGGFGATFGVPIGSLIMEQYIRGELSAASQARAASIAARAVN